MIDLKISPDGADPYNITVGSRDILQWEKTHKGKTFSGLMAELAMVDLYWLGWQASCRLGHFSGKLSDFEALHEVSYQEDEQEDVDPTPSAPSPEA